MAGKGDIVEQALKLVMGGGDDAAKKAFANTRLKTPQGDPMRLYHMTPEDIFEFRASPENRSGPAVFLSPYSDYQPAYHQSAETDPSGELTERFKEGANVMPVYADVRNPLVLDHPRKIREAAAKYQGGDPQFPRIISPEARSSMEAEGYDGIVFGGDNPIPYGDRPMDARLGHQEARDEEFLVFDPKRVKSAVSNTGEYDFANPDITKAEGGQVREGYAGKGRVVKNVIEGISNVVAGRSPNRVFPELANRYPEVKDPVTAFDKKTGKEYLAKDLSPEALAVEQARKVIQKDIDAGQYQPFFDVKARSDVDPFNYPSTGKTIDVKPVKPETQAKYRAMAFNPEGLSRLREGYTAGLEQKDVAENWYFVKQLEDKFVEEYGPEEGRRLFKERFAKPMALTTGGADPTSNLLMGYYGNFLREKGLPIPEAAYEMPYPIGGRFASSNMGMFGRNMEKELTPDNPKRLNFQNNFLGHKEPTLDEQMSKGFDPKLQMPEWYGPYEEAINMLAREYDVDPRYFQEVTWAGLKSKGKGGYQGMPMIQHVNEAIERTSRLTGLPPEEVVRRGLVRAEMPIYGMAAPAGALAVGAMDEDADEDIDNAVRIAKDVGGSASTPVLMEDAKGNKYDAQGNIIPPTNPGPNPARSDVTPQSVAAKAVNDPATYDALMERYAIPDRDIAEYKALRETVGKQPQAVQQMTHVGDRPRREMTVDMPLFGGEYSMGTAPYDVASGISGAAQTAYDFKTAPFYLNPFTAPIAAGMDVAEGIATNDPLTASLAIAFGPGGKYVKAAGVGATNYFMNPDEAEAGPERWFSKAMEVARAIPMEKMTGQQALAMLRKGVSPEELKWTGADVFLPQQKQITKQDLVDYLGKNRVQTQDVVLGGNKLTRREDVVLDDEIKAKYRDENNNLQAELGRLGNILNAGRKGGIEESEFRAAEKQYVNARERATALTTKMLDEQIAKMGGLGLPTKYQDYSTAGGEGYTETLYQLGRHTGPSKVVRKGPMWHVVGPDGETLRNQSGGPYTYYNQNDAERAAKILYKESGTYRSPHWNEPDVFAHTRSNTLTYEPPGSNRPYKVHNVEETQSDLAQAGRKRGFKDPQAMAAVAKLRQEEARLRAELKSEQNRLYKEHQERIAPHTEERVRYERELREKYKRGEISLGDMNRAAEEYPSPEQELTGQYRAATYETLNPIMDKIAANEAEIERIGKNIGDMPLMPYVSNTEGWTDFAIKKELDRALDSDADYFSWSPGEVHAERYNLSRHIGKVQYNPDDGSLFAYDPKGKMVVNESVDDPSDLDEYVGKELADKMRAEAASRSDAIDDAYEVGRDEDADGWTVTMYGEPAYGRNGNPLVFGSRGEAKDYINEMKANDYASNPVELSGLDLKTGGEGMRGYYDKIYLKRVQEVIKKSTGIKPEIETITVNTADGPRQQLGVRITDEMREKARFSDFNKGGRVSDPIVNKALSLTRY